MICKRCGLCCISQPCFHIPFNHEKKSKQGFHICKHLSFIGEKASCSLYKGIGECSSKHSNDYANNIELLHFKNLLMNTRKKEWSQL